MELADIDEAFGAKPLLDFFTRVAGLVSRRIPVERVEYSPLRIGMHTVGEQSPGDVADNGDLPDAVKRNGKPANGVQQTMRQVNGDEPVQFARDAETVRGVIHPDRDSPAGLEKPRQLSECLFAIRRMIQHTDAVNEIERAFAKGRIENIGLKNTHILSAGEIVVRRFDSLAQIERHNVAAPSAHHIGKSSHAAAGVQHQLPPQVLWCESGFLPKRLCGFMAMLAIQLGGRMPRPFESEIARVHLRIDKARNPFGNRVQP